MKWCLLVPLEEAVQMLLKEKQGCCHAPFSSSTSNFSQLIDLLGRAVIGSTFYLFDFCFFLLTFSLHLNPAINAFTFGFLVPSSRASDALHLELWVQGADLWDYPINTLAFQKCSSSLSIHPSYSFWWTRSHRLQCTRNVPQWIHHGFPKTTDHQSGHLQLRDPPVRGHRQGNTVTWEAIHNAAGHWPSLEDDAWDDSALHQALTWWPPRYGRHPQQAEQASSMTLPLLSKRSNTRFSSCTHIIGINNTPEAFVNAGIIIRYQKELRIREYSYFGE